MMMVEMLYFLFLVSIGSESPSVRFKPSAVIQEEDEETEVEESNVSNPEDQTREGEVEKEEREDLTEVNLNEQSESNCDDQSGEKRRHSDTDTEPNTPEQSGGLSVVRLSISYLLILSFPLFSFISSLLLSLSLFFFSIPLLSLSSFLLFLLFHPPSLLSSPLVSIFP